MVFRTLPLDFQLLINGDFKSPLFNARQKSAQDAFDNDAYGTQQPFLTSHFTYDLTIIGVQDG